jgi:hypothetical protein
MSRYRKHNKRVPVNSVREAFLTKWFNHFRFDKVWDCPHCRTENGWFKSMSVEPDLITWNFHCQNCNMKFIRKLDFKRLLRLHLNYNEMTNRKNLPEFNDCYKIFLTCLDYPDFFQDKESGEFYQVVWEKLRAESAGKMKIWNKIQKVWDKVL